eukprot:m51a1_g5544 hypothetical protein (113) ;mRNA; f:485388-485726
MSLRRIHQRQEHQRLYQRLVHERNVVLVLALIRDSEADDLRKRVARLRHEIRLCRTAPAGVPKALVAHIQRDIEETTHRRRAASDDAGVFLLVALVLHARARAQRRAAEYDS